MAFSPALLERLRAQVMLSALIGRYVPLKRHGKEYTGLCPFHGEKTPSFTVNDAKGFFHCFGCAAHGDAINFVERYERISWREAVEKLAREAGIAIAESSPAEQAREQREKGLLEAMEAAAAWFEAQLAAAPHYAARDYVAARRLSAATVKQFRIGYAGDAREGLKRHLLTKGFAENTLVEAGLLIRPDDGATYDRFRARLMFPIRNARGRVIAFGGRLIAPAQAHAPKYLNSPETPLFHKGEVLFNLDQALAPARAQGTLIIVEGYMDAIAMAQAGFAHSVATLGTAVTEAHLKSIWRSVSAPVLCLDGDAAGMRASLRAAELALPLATPEHSLRFAFLPKGEDPDSLIARAGAEALSRCIGSSSDLVETLWRIFANTGDASAHGRAALEEKLMAHAQRIAHPVLRKHARDFFRERLWAKFHPRNPASTRRALSMPSAPSGGVHALRQALSLALAQPGLLEDARVEHHLAHLDCEDAGLDTLRQALLHLAADEPEAGEEFRAKLEALGHARALSSVPHLPMVSSLQAARSLWQSVFEARALAALETEHAELERREADDAVCLRLSEVQAQIRALRKRALAEADDAA